MHSLVDCQCGVKHLICTLLLVLWYTPDTFLTLAYVCTTYMKYYYPAYI